MAFRRATSSGILLKQISATTSAWLVILMLKMDGAITIHQDVRLYAACLNTDNTIEHVINPTATRGYSFSSARLR